jgi:hypothetical protein
MMGLSGSHARLTLTDNEMDSGTWDEKRVIVTVAIETQAYFATEDKLQAADACCDPGLPRDQATASSGGFW